MAALSNKRGDLIFQLDPMPPSAEGPNNAYNVIIREQGQIVFERQYTTYADSPDGHWNIWLLFRALQLAEELAARRTPFSLTGRDDGLFHEPYALSVDVGWLHAVLSADTLTHRHNLPHPVQEKRASLVAYLLTEPQETNETPECKQFRMRCDPAAVVAFGQALEAECREALRLRCELGMLAPADEYTDDA